MLTLMTTIIANSTIILHHTKPLNQLLNQTITVTEEINTILMESTLKTSQAPISLLFFKEERNDNKRASKNKKQILYFYKII